jgi:hypothetical protein
MGLSTPSNVCLTGVLRSSTFPDSYLHVPARRGRMIGSLLIGTAAYEHLLGAVALGSSQMSPGEKSSDETWPWLPARRGRSMDERIEVLAKLSFTL